MSGDYPRPLAPPSANLPTYRPRDKDAHRRAPPPWRLPADLLAEISGATLTEADYRGIREWVTRRERLRRERPSRERFDSFVELQDQLDAMHYRGEAPRFDEPEDG